MSGPLAAWREAIPHARWFAGKGRAGVLVELTPLPWYTPEGALPALRSEIGRVAYPDGQEYYHLLSGYLPAGTAEPQALLATMDVAGLGTVDLVDAVVSPTAMRAWCHAAEQAPGLAWLHPASLQGEPELFTGEQSNSMVTLGQFLIKIFRRLEPGANLDVAALVALDATTATPRLDAVIAPASTAEVLGAATELGFIGQRLLGVRDGWEAACESCSVDGDFQAAARDLGAALARIHSDLALAFGTTSISTAELAATIQIRAGRIAALEPSVASGFAALLALVAGLPKGTLPVQRIHGDFHLGQALLGESGWFVIDFEGEPMRPLAERRLPDLTWRDVAGALRSFDYARSAHPDPDSEAARAWSRACQEAFLTGYGAPTGLERTLLDALQLDKAIYEVHYELHNRPEWAHIPLAAVHDGQRRATHL